jgi:acyl carrier protein
MQNSEIYPKISEILSDLLDRPVAVGPETTASGVHGWDSFNHINLIISIEAEFRVKFNAAEMETMHNVGALVDRIEKKLAEQGR